MFYKDWLEDWLSNYIMPTAKDKTYSRYVDIVDHHLSPKLGDYLLEDLTPYKKDLELDTFYPKSVQTLSWEGKVYGVPRDISNLVIYYNKSLFDKKRVSYPKKGWSYEQFLDTAKKLTNVPEVFGISFEEEPLFYMPYLMTFGVEGVPRFEDERVQTALKNYADLRHKYKVAPLKEHSASATMAQMFLQGRLGM